MSTGTYYHHLHRVDYIEERHIRPAVSWLERHDFTVCGLAMYAPGHFVLISWREVTVHNASDQDWTASMDLP